TAFPWWASGGPVRRRGRPSLRPRPGSRCACRHIGRQAHRDDETASLADSCRRPPAVSCGDGRDDRESEPGTATRAGPGRVSADEGLEERRDRRRSTRLAAVRAPRGRVAAGLAGLDANEAARLVVAQGVLDEVGDQALEQLAVAAAPGRPAVDLDADA